MSEAFFATAEELSRLAPADYPAELVQNRHLIHSSPASLAFNSPGAQGFGVKRAGLAIPGSVMLLVSPACCGRNTRALGGPDSEYADRIFYMLLDETDIVTGRYQHKIPEAVRELRDELETPPSCVLLCSTCVDALLGLDEAGICRRASEAAGLPVLPCTMYALTREGKTPPMAAVRRTVYSLLEPLPRDPASLNLLGFFTPLADDCELYTLCRQAGIRHIRELTRCRDMAEYADLARAGCNLVLHPESRLAAQWMLDKLNIPFVEIVRCYQPEKIHTQYRLLGQVLGLSLDDGPYLEQSRARLADFRARFGELVFALGEVADADPFELALALVRSGFRVAEIFGTVGAGNAVFIQRLAEISPKTRIYSNLSPTMLFYAPRPGEVDVAVGRDARSYHPDAPGTAWCNPRQPFGHAGLRRLLAELERALAGGQENSVRQVFA